MTARTLTLLVLLALAAAAELPIFDAHVHYSHDAWENLPPEDAGAILRKAGGRRALVSSSGDEGTQRLVAEPPDSCVPSLRPYRSRGDVGTWVRDDTVVAVPGGTPAQQSATRRSATSTCTAPMPTCRCRAGWSRWRSKHELVLHAHSDTDAVERLFRQDPAPASCGRTRLRAARRVREMLRKHKNLWCDLAFRSDQGSGGKLRRSGARCSSSFRTASWSAPTRSRRSVGTTSSSTRAGRARGSPTCRPPLAERIPLAQRRGALRVLEARNDAAMSAAGPPPKARIPPPRGAAPRREPTRRVGGSYKRMPPHQRDLLARDVLASGPTARRRRAASDLVGAPRHVVDNAHYTIAYATKPDPIPMGPQHFVVEFSVCARAGAKASAGGPRRCEHAGAQARHELSSRRDDDPPRAPCGTRRMLFHMPADWVPDLRRRCRQYDRAGGPKTIRLD